MENQCIIHSPDQNIPVLVTEPTIEAGSDISEFDVIENIGGGEIIASSHRFKAYKTGDGSIIHIKRSKYLF
jgi:hypothetical protein